MIGPYSFVERSSCLHTGPQSILRRSAMRGAWGGIRSTRSTPADHHIWPASRDRMCLIAPRTEPVAVIGQLEVLAREIRRRQQEQAALAQLTEFNIALEIGTFG